MEPFRPHEAQDFVYDENTPIGGRSTLRQTDSSNVSYNTVYHETSPKHGRAALHNHEAAQVGHDTLHRDDAINGGRSTLQHHGAPLPSYPAPPIYPEPGSYHDGMQVIHTHTGRRVRIMDPNSENGYSMVAGGKRTYTDVAEENSAEHYAHAPVVYPHPAPAPAPLHAAKRYAATVDRATTFDMGELKGVVSSIVDKRVTEAVSTCFDGVNTRFDGVNTRFNGIDTGMTTLDEACAGRNETQHKDIKSLKDTRREHSNDLETLKSAVREIPGINDRLTSRTSDIQTHQTILEDHEQRLTAQLNRLIAAERAAETAKKDSEKAVKALKQELEDYKETVEKQNKAFEATIAAQQEQINTLLGRLGDVNIQALNARVEAALPDPTIQQAQQVTSQGGFLRGPWGLFGGRARQAEVNAIVENEVEKGASKDVVEQEE